MFPPTPAPSTDIAPKPPPSLSNVELSFQLPPPAICNPSASSPSGSLSSLSASQDALVRATPVSPAKKRHSKQKYPPSPSSPGNPTVPAVTSIYTPIAPMPAQLAPALPSDNQNILPLQSPLQSIKRSSATQAAAGSSQQKRKEREEDLLDKQQLAQAKQQKTCSNSTPKGSVGGCTDSPSSSVTLPPPPGRSRKIIQMRPKPMSSDTTVAGSTRPSSSSSSKAKLGSGGRKKAAVNTAPVAPQPPVQPPKPTAATRKTARKTAHSLIERRRRFKMNEEFAVLKSMIPACRGVEMHKLAILQASIEYLRYLEECVEELKKRVGGDSVVGTISGRMRSSSGIDQEQGLENLEDISAIVDQDFDDGEEDDREEKEHHDPNIDPDLNTPATGGSENHLDTSLTFVNHQQLFNHHSPYEGLLHSAPPTLAHPSSQPLHQALPSNQSSPSIPPPSPSYSRKQYTPKHKNQFVNTQNIPQELLPPPILSPTTFKCPPYSLSAAQPASSSSTPWLNPHPNSAYPHTSPVLVPLSHSRTSSVVASPRTMMPLQTPTDEQVSQGRDEDREVTHALLLLADGGGDGDRRQQSSGQRPSVRGRTMSVKDLLSS